MNRIHFIFLLLLMGSAAFSQDTSTFRKNLIGKWYPEKYLETDGKIYPVSEDEKSQYVWYKADGTVESIEEEGLVKGTWSMNSSKMILVVTQKQSKGYPQKMEMKIVKLTATQLAVKAKDGGGDYITIYFSKK
ncbi:MAG TPA: lipocalin family protein [Chitinophagales bacterium]|nr:lipocalin family protein [Chitinophagales bacterium]